MSHFCVAVLSDGTKTVDELLAPYQENDMNDVPREYLAFEDIEDEYRRKHKTESVEFVYVQEDDRLYRPFDEVFGKPETKDELGWSPSYCEAPDGLPRVKVPIKWLYHDFDDYMRDWCDERRDPETGRYGCWENPNAKWDWWTEGGRWRSWADETIGGTCVRVGDIAFDPQLERMQAERWWAFNVDGGRADELEIYSKTRGMSRKQYVEAESHLHFWAVVTPDGEWHECEEMGWFGMSGGNPDGWHDWCVGFEGRFLADPDLALTVVDCHI